MEVDFPFMHNSKHDVDQHEMIKKTYCLDNPEKVFFTGDYATTFFKGLYV
jgi:hypothetical protein